jgi:hypothetical protein
MTAAGPFAVSSTSRISELSLTPSNDKSHETKVPYSANNHGRSLQHVPRLQRQSSPRSSAEFVTQPRLPHLRGFHSGTLTITSSPSVSLSSVQKRRSARPRPINDTFPSAKSSSPVPKPSAQDSDSDSDSDTPLLYLVSKANKHPSVGSKANSQLEDRVIASSSGNPGIQTTTRSRDNSEFSSASLTLPTRTTDIESVRISQDSHDRTRRILVPSSGSSLINLTSHGFMDIFNLSPLRF